MNQVPFSTRNELCKSLTITQQGHTDVIQRIQKPSQQKDYLPGEPNIPLSSTTISTDLKEELVTRVLDQLAPHFWLVAKQDSSHVSSLTHQIVRGRQIIVTEKPGLHLIWYYDTVFIKPLPKYLLSHAFWSFYLISETSPIPEPLRVELRRSALGFLRSYRYLIQRQSDYNIAMTQGLLPKKTKYADFIRLIRSLDSVDDSMVTPRYHYGELRLSRLNFWIKIFQFRFAYHNTADQYNKYFARFYGPILFIFGVISVLLSAMQVVMGAIPMMADLKAPWLAFVVVSRGFSVFTLFVTAVILAFLVLALIALVSRESIFALKDMYHKGRQRRRTMSACESTGEKL